jgi:hypothetical protein
VSGHPTDPPGIDLINLGPDFYPLWVEGVPQFDRNVSPVRALRGGGAQVAAFWKT